MILVGALLQVVVFALGGLLLQGYLARMRSRAEGRRGAPITQPLRETLKWWGKESLRSAESSAWTRVAPVILLTLALLGAALVPLVELPGSSNLSLDLVGGTLVWMSGSLILVLLALDPGTAFGGMGASRAVTLAALAEPALLVAVVGLSVGAGSSSSSAILLGEIHHTAQVVSPAHLLLGVALLVVLLTETGRMPVDNPATHLELTMIHEALVLELAGQDYALVSLAENLRFGWIVGLVATLLVPFGVASGGGVVALILSGGVLVVKMTVLATLVGIIEISSAKLRLFRVPELLAGGVVSAVLGTIATVVAR